MPESTAFFPMAETILLVEDEPGLRRLVQRILTRLAYQVIVAGTGEAAIVACRDHQEGIDLVITDVFMPGITGPDLAARLHAMRPGLKVLSVSGSSESLIESGMLTHDADFLQKPFTTDQFAKKVREILDR